MSFQSKLKEAAEKLSAMAKARISDSDREISELAQEKIRLVDKRDIARISVERGATYQPAHGLKYLCPYCWVIHGQMSPLVYLLSPTNAETYRCDSCQSEFRLRLIDQGLVRSPDDRPLQECYRCTIALAPTATRSQKSMPIGLGGAE